MRQSNICGGIFYAVGVLRRQASHQSLGGGPLLCHHLSIFLSSSLSLSFLSLSFISCAFSSPPPSPSQTHLYCVVSLYLLTHLSFVLPSSPLYPSSPSINIPFFTQSLSSLFLSPSPSSSTPPTLSLSPPLSWFNVFLIFYPSISSVSLSFSLHLSVFKRLSLSFSSPPSLILTSPPNPSPPHFSRGLSLSLVLSLLLSCLFPLLVLPVAMTWRSAQALTMGIILLGYLQAPFSALTSHDTSSVKRQTGKA